MKFSKSLAARGAIFVMSLLAMRLTARAQAPQPEESRFVRFVADDNGGGKLQTAIISYQDKNGVHVDLIAAVHIADASYFHDLQKGFTGYDALLYELVKPKEVAPPQPGMARPQGARPLAWVGFLQQFMKESLDLSFQLDEIDYSKPNFVHADLDAETFQKMQADRGESMFTIMLQQMLHEMTRVDDATAPAAAEPDLSQLLIALQSPDRPRQIKLMLARQLGELDALFGGSAGMEGTVILTERNRAALATLRKRIDAGDKKIGIFYGAAHLKEMEKDLTGLMGFKQVGEPQWHTAWDLTQPTPQPVAPAR